MRRFTAKEVDIVVEKLTASGVFDGIQFQVAGSWRRGKSDQKDIDILVMGDCIDTVRSRLAAIYPDGAEGGTGTKVGGKTKRAILRWNVPVDETDFVMLDFVFVKDPDTWGAALLFFSGSAAFNIRMRAAAKRKGFKLSQNGLFNRDTGELVASKTEEDIFAALGWKYMEPMERES